MKENSRLAPKWRSQYAGLLAKTFAKPAEQVRVGRARRRRTREAQVGQAERRAKEGSIKGGTAQFAGMSLHWLRLPERGCTAFWTTPPSIYMFQLPAKYTAGEKSKKKKEINNHVAALQQ